MDNTVDALQMAAGLIFGVLLLAALVYVFNIISNSENTKQEMAVVEQSTEFNKKYLAFDKTSMYGTDLISVLSMAISNNQICNTENSLHPTGEYNENIDGAINIEFTINSDIESKQVTTEQEYKRVNDNWEWTNTKDPEKKAITLLKAGTYDLTPGNTSTGNEKIAILTKIVTEGNQTTQKIKQITTTKRKIIETDTSGFNQLKQKVFECSKVEYTGTGKIYKMSFKERQSI